jgi:hypothetical protein
MRPKAHTALLVFLACSFSFIFAFKQNPDEVLLYQENFQDGLASGWDLNPGWEVIQEDNNYVLAGQGHVWANPPTQNAADFRLLLRVKILRGRIHLV